MTSFDTWGRTTLDSRFTRRQVIGGSTRLGLALAVGLPLLQACGDDDPVCRRPGKNTEAIKDGLTPEAGPLRIFNYDSYVSPDIVASFEEKYGVKVEITTFTTDDEAITKLASGAVDVDLDHSAVDDDVVQVGRDRADPAAQQELPHQHRQRRRFVARPVLRQGRHVHRSLHRASAPASGSAPIGSTPATVSWDTLWNPEYKGVTSLLDDVREGLTAAMLRKGLTDLNTARSGGHQAGR